MIILGLIFVLVLLGILKSSRVVVLRSEQITNLPAKPWAACRDPARMTGPAAAVVAEAAAVGGEATMA